MPRDHEVIGRLAEASGDMWTVVGFVEEGVAAQIHNSLAVLRHGTIAFLHRKLNLATFGKLEEGKHFAGGDRKSVVSGRSVSVRVVLSGSRIMKKKNKNKNR